MRCRVFNVFSTCPLCLCVCVSSFCLSIAAPKFNKYLAYGLADRSLRVCILQTSVRYPRRGAPVAVHEHLHDDSQIACAAVTDDGQVR